MPIYDNFSTDPGSNTKSPPLGAPEGALPNKQISDTFRVVMASIAELADVFGQIGPATAEVAGLVRRATTDEVAAGADLEAYITPAGLLARTATDTRIGLVELATAAEAIAGSDVARAVTAAGLAALTSTTTRRGLIEGATNAEVETGTDSERAVVPSSLAALVNKANPGYVKHPSGMIIQFGNNTTGASGFKTVTYPVVLTTTALFVNVSPLGSENYIGRPATSTTSNFGAQLFDLAGDAAPSGVTFFWLSIGY